MEPLHSSCFITHPQIQESEFNFQNKQYSLELMFIAYLILDKT